jgi:Trypsin-like peptidase domain
MFKMQLLGACFAMLLAPVDSSALSVGEIVSKAKPSVLKVTAYEDNGLLLRFGTGFFTSDDGRLITTRRMIEGAKAITAETASGASYQCEGVLLAPKDVDLVVLKFKARGVEKLLLGGSSKLKQGQKVVVIEGSDGIESRFSEGTIAAITDNPRFIQIEAPISPASSGSPILDENGRVIGITTLIHNVWQNLSFSAISADEVTKVLASIPNEASITPLLQTDGKSGEVLKNLTETAKNLGEALAFVGAALFFLYKAVTGYQTFNASISIQCQRRKQKVGPMDVLVVSTTLKKGERGTVALKDAWARVTPEKETFQLKRFIGIDRLVYEIDKELSEKDPNLWKSDKDPINLAPGEEATFSCAFIVPGDKYCEVEVVVFGVTVFFVSTWQKSRPVQWRASAVSLPELETKNESSS